MTATQEIKKDKLTYCVLGPSGDDRLIWDKRDPDSMKQAQEKFYELLDKGYLLFGVGEDGNKASRRLLRFDPNAEEVIAVPFLVGG